MPTRKQFNPPAILPARFRVRVTKVDAEDAICGSVTDCTLARAVEHMLRRAKLLAPTETKPHDFYIKIKPNRAMVRLKKVYHHFNMPDKAADIIRQTDAGDFELIRETSIVLTLVRTARQVAVWRDPTRKAQINQARQLRRELGRPDKCTPTSALRPRSATGCVARN